MAGLYFTVKPVSPITITTGSGPITLLQIVAPTNQRVLVPKLSISFNGVTAADPPVLLEVLYQSSAGTMSALTPVKWNSSDTETIQTTAQFTASAEPTAGNILWGDYIHTQTGDNIEPVTLRIPGFIVPGGSRLGLRYTSGTVTGTVKAIPCFLCEE